MLARSLHRARSRRPSPSSASASSSSSSMDSKKPNKIMEIVRLQQMLKKWKKLAVARKANSRSIKFLKRTLSFSDGAAAASSSSSSPPRLGEGGDVAVVPRGCLAVCVGEEMRRFVIPTEYLGHRAFAALLKEAEEEFGFQQEGVLRIPCEVRVFEGILSVVEKNKDCRSWYCSAEMAAAAASAISDELASSHLPPKPVCR